jgi:membrane dipeptidase
MIADAHTDLLLELAYREHRLGESDVFAQTWLPLLAAGGVGLQVCPIFVDLDRQPEGTLREALAQATSFARAVRESPDHVAAVRTGADLDAVERGERIGLLLSLEGVEQFGYEVWPADAFWELGVRMASLTWNRRNPYADGAAETGGLSRLGERLVDRLVELGVILDLAHASPATFADVLARSGDAPILVSHAACRAVNDHPRNLTDEQMRALADRGGLLGLMLHPLAIGPERRTIARVIDHLEHAAEVMGADRICLGGDFVQRLSQVLPPSAPLPDGLMPPGLESGSAIEQLAGPEDYPALVEALIARGWPAGEIAAVVAGNLLGLLRRGLPQS